MADHQTPRTTAQQTPVVTCQARATQMAPTFVSASTGGYVLTSASNLRPVGGNYTLVAGPQAPAHQYVVQTAARATAAPQQQQYMTAAGVTYVLPSGAQLVRMSNVVPTATAAGAPAQYILTSGSTKANPAVLSPMAAQTLKTVAVASGAENSANTSGTVTLSRSLGMTTTSPIIQKTGVQIPRLNTAFYSQVKGAESPRISFRPKLNEQKPGTSYILTSNVQRAKNVPISSLQKVNANYMQILQKPSTVLSANTVKSNVDIQQQPIRSVILPTNYRTTVSQQQNTDCKLVLNPINVTSQVLNSNDAKPTNMLSTPVSNIQQLNTNYVQIPIAQKPASILTRANLQPNTESNNINNIRIGQQPNPSIRSVILPANYRTAMVSSPQKSVDYRLILKPVNIQSPQTNIIKNMAPSRFPRNPSIRNTTLRPTASSARPISMPTRVPVVRMPSTRTQTEIIADSKINPIPLKERKNQLVITKKSIQICVDEINKKNPTTDNQLYLKIDEPAIETIQAEVTYRLFYLLRECKKVLVRSRSTVLTEESVSQVCAEYFETFYGNKLWPLFCLKPNSGDSTGEDRVWIRKHNNVNLIGWLKHPKFQNPSYVKKRQRCLSKRANLKWEELMDLSDVVCDGAAQPTGTNQSTVDSPTNSKICFQSSKKNQVPFSTILPENNTREIICDGLLFKPKSHSITDIL